MKKSFIRVLAALALSCSLGGTVAGEIQRPETWLQLRMVDSIEFRVAAPDWHSLLEAAPHHDYRFATALPDRPPAWVSLLCALLAAFFIALRRLRRN